MDLSPLAASRPLEVVEVSAGRWRPRPDAVAVEEPLFIQLRHGPARERRRLAFTTTLRTPGSDEDLALGMLVTEGLVTRRDHVLSVERFDGTSLRVDLHPEVAVDEGRYHRRGVMSSACGLCGKTLLDALEVECPPLAPGPTVAATLLHLLPERLRPSQAVFAETGGLHAAAFVSLAGDLLATREDIGRHNAVDKLIGAGFDRPGFPPPILFVSGRAGFELVQKAAVVGVPIFVAVGAPSSLAVELARRVGMTLVGFARGERFNIYAHPERILP